MQICSFLSSFSANVRQSRIRSGFLLVCAIALLSAGCSRNPLGTRSASAGNSQQPTTEVANPNSPKASLVKYLNSQGAKMYGTYWCPYCTRQKEMFGDTIHQLQVIECDPKGQNAQPNVCIDANVSSYPTWEINGKLYRGMRSLEELAVISGYKGSMNFDN